MNPNHIDLNLLRVFNQLMTDRSVSRVALALGVSQPAVSNALKRLRALLGDELFLRTAQGMQPTPLAEHLAEPIGRAIETIRSAVAQELLFDPASAKRSFVVGLTELGQLYFLPRLLGCFSQQAPGVRLIIVRSDAPGLKEDMENGRTDLALGLLPELHGSFFRQRLFQEPLVLAYRKAHPLDRPGVLQQAELADYGQLDVAALASGQSEFDRAARCEAADSPIRATLPNLLAVGEILARTDLLATVPLRLAQMLSTTYGLSFGAHPRALPAQGSDLFWHARLHRDPANQWLRRIVFGLFSDAGADAVPTSPGFAAAPTPPQ